MDLTDQQRIALGAALSELQLSAGWKFFVGLMETHKAAIGQAALRDEKRSREYYVGKLDEVEDLIETIYKLVEQAQELREESEGGGSEVLAPRLGGGLAVGG